MSSTGRQLPARRQVRLGVTLTGGARGGDGALCLSVNLQSSHHRKAEGDRVRGGGADRPIPVVTPLAHASSRRRPRLAPVQAACVSHASAKPGEEKKSVCS